MIDEVFKELGNQIGAQMSILQGAHNIRKLTKNRRAGYGRFASKEVDSLFHKFNAESGSATSHLQFKQDLVIDYLDAGSNDLASFTLDTSDDMVAGLWLYLVGLYRRSDFDTAQLNTYYQTLTSTQSSYQTTWVTTYGRGNGDDITRYNAFMLYMLRGAGKSMNFDLKQLIDEVFYDTDRATEAKGLVDIIDASDQDTRDLIINKLTRFFIEQERDDYDSDEGRDLLRSRINNRFYSDAERGEMSTLVDSLGLQQTGQESPPLVVGPSNSGGETCQPVMTTAEVSVAKADITSRLRRYADLDNTQGILDSIAIAGTEGVIGNYTLKQESLVSLNALDTTDDPMATYMTKLENYFAAIGVSGATALEAAIHDYFENLASAGVSKTVRLRIRNNLRGWLGQSLRESDRDRYWDDLTLRTVDNSGTNRLNRINVLGYLDAILYGAIPSTVRTLYTNEFNSLTTGVYQARLTRINDLLVPTGESLTPSSTYITLLTNFINTDIAISGSKLTTDDRQKVLDCIAALQAGGIVQDEIDMNIQKIAGVMKRLSLPSSTREFKELCHALVGNFLYEADRARLKDEQDGLFLLTGNHDRLSYIASLLQDKEFLGTVKTDFTTLILSNYTAQSGARLSRVTKLATLSVFSQSNESATISSTITYKGVLNSKDIVPGTVSIVVGSDTYKDSSGNGDLSPVGNLVSGTVDYDTGDFVLTFANATSGSYTATYEWNMTNLEAQLIIAELTFFFDEIDTVGNLSHLQVLTGVQALTALGLTESGVASSISSLTTLVNGLNIPSGDKTRSVALLSPLSNGFREPTEIAAYRAAVYADTPSGSLTTELTQVESLFNALLATVGSVSVNRDQRLNAKDASYSVPVEFTERRGSLEDKLSQALNNSTPKFRLSSFTTGDITVYNIYTPGDSTYNSLPYSQSGGPKYEWFGGDRLLDKIYRLNDWDSVIYRSYNSVNRIISRVRDGLNGISMKIADIRYALQSLKSFIRNKLQTVADNVANILCSVDFLYDVISAVNGVVRNIFDLARSTVDNLSGVVADVNEVIAQAKATLATLVETLGNFGRINMDIECECVSFNMSLDLSINRKFANDLADWLMNFPLELNDPFAGLQSLLNRYEDALTMDPKMGCPSSIISGLPSPSFAANIQPFFATGTVQFPPKF